MKKYRWEKNNDHISIESVISTDLGESALVVASNLGLANLPPAFRKQVAQSNQLECEQLIEQVNNYAQENGYIKIDL